MRYLFCILLLFLFIFSYHPILAANCDDACVDDTDCTAACRYCNVGGSDVCESCCQFFSLGSCPAASCHWDAGTEECRDVIGLSCTGVPEAPKMPLWVWLLLSLGVIATVETIRRRYSKKKKMTTD